MFPTESKQVITPFRCSERRSSVTIGENQMKRYAFVPAGEGPNYDWAQDHTFVRYRPPIQVALSHSWKIT